MKRALFWFKTKKEESSNPSTSGITGTAQESEEASDDDDFTHSTSSN
jgi:hypothetical protein